LVIPPGQSYLQDYCDEQLTVEALQNHNGYALAILCERQYQDKDYLKGASWGGEPSRKIREVRQQVRERRKLLRKINKHFYRTKRQRALQFYLVLDQSGEINML